MIARLGAPGLAALIGLVWLCVPVAEFLEDDGASTAQRIAVLGAVGVFAAYVVWLLARDGEPSPRAAALPAAITVGLAIAGRDEWIAVMAVFVAVFLADGLRGRRVAAAVVGVAAGAVALMLVAGTDTDELFYDLFIILTISSTIAAINALERANRELREARAELARVAVAEERRRFARDLHDLLGHSLSLIAIKARLAQRVQHSDPARATQELIDIEQASRTSLAEVRETVSGYRRATFAGELVGVRAALESAGVRLDTRVTRLQLDAEDEAVLAWALREAATNVVRHADASHVVVRLVPAGAGARLEVDDDGRGEPHAAGNGLRGLSERVAARDGRLDAGPRPEGGFRLAVELPGSE